MRKYDETKRLKVLGINVDSNTVFIKYIPNTARAIQKELGCTEFGSDAFVSHGETYRVLYDQEGLCKIKPKASVVSESGQPMVVGNILIVKDKSDWSEFLSLDMNDIRRLMLHIEFNEDFGYHVFVKGDNS